MTNFIPIFPLELVVFPGESLNLHIFEPRYKELIRDCRESGKSFGIPSVINGRLGEYGTRMELVEVVKEYENGESDIKTRGMEVFKILELIRSVPGKLYGGSIVHYPDNEAGMGSRELMKLILVALKELHTLLNVNPVFSKPEAELTSYDIAHHAGLSLEEENELRALMHELQRQEYLRRHLQKVLPVLREMEHLKQKVKLNGHFKNLSSLDLNL